MATPSLRSIGVLGRTLRQSQRTFSTSARFLDNSSVPAKQRSETSPATIEEVGQAPNRVQKWSRSQKSRSQAMIGPRFEQTDYELQPQPLSAMDLIHQEPVRWTHSRVVECEGGGGPAGHPRIFINTDKPEIAVCNYCGTPFANEHHRKHLESLPETSYPLQ